MKALVYQDPGKKTIEDRPKPEIQEPTDAIVKITKTTICGTDLHILKGDVPRSHPLLKSAMLKGPRSPSTLNHITDLLGIPQLLQQVY